MTALDSPVWTALTSDQQALGIGGPLAKRYHPDVSPFAAVAERTPEAFAALAALIPADSLAFMHTPDPLVLPDRFAVEWQKPLLQMVLGAPAVPADGPEHLTLGPDDVPEMIDLASRTRPGPFGPRTIDFGTYIGLRIDGRLAAMAGERMRLGRTVEISAVCVDPDFRGRGYATLLMMRLASRMQAAGETPFLHVLAENTSAIALYERLGFVTRGSFFVTVFRHADGTA